MRDLGLVVVVLLRVAVAAVDHQTRVQTLGLELLASLVDALCIEVCALLSTAENDEAVVVANGADDGDNTGLGHRKEVMWVLDGANGVNGNVEAAVGTVFEANREGET